MRLWLTCRFPPYASARIPKKRPHLVLAAHDGAHVGHEERFMDDVARVDRLTLLVDADGPRKVNRVAHANAVGNEIFKRPKRDNLLLSHGVPPSRWRERAYLNDLSTG